MGKITKAQIAIFVIIALFLAGGVIIYSLLISLNKPTVEIHECETDNDCVPNDCCYATSCVSKMEENEECLIVGYCDETANPKCVCVDYKCKKLE